ncbi:GNAT family N-acetyltransferase [Dongia soli]|uniref:GNAT family N-acetyltransferase n=1 Tax=Dongia soli TaxID=600628 RepID=A0ABU5EC38_9PROT|nr:GNAT family N-acetyltransferase [Dongia soli]MDY0883736.1 GNAT family N-acetyltransferase [Dongia soli]
MQARIIDSLSEITAEEWDACAGWNGDGTGTNPFVAHAFLSALERSGSVGRKSGWLPQHLLIEDESGRLQAACPLYVKGHSYGEYVFDHGWADAYERAGGRYYPKLQVAVPFTPVPGPRLLVRPGPNGAAIRQALIETLITTVRRSKMSSLHVTFCTAEEAAAFSESGLLHRRGVQYHWHNQGYGSFDDFLAALNSRKRKAIRKERAAVENYGLTIRQLSGNEIEKRHWDAFFDFYMDTGNRKWGQPYLTRRFFDLIGETMDEQVVLMLAEKNGQPVAGALNLRGADALYGRNWGCLADYRFLHFELCYYQAIDYAIAHKLARVEAGAQGEHKIQRGYLPVETHSAHWITDPSFRDAVAEFLNRESRALEYEMAELADYGPFRRSEK